MKYDAAFEALKRANPEPDPAALRKELGERSTPVALDTVTRQRPTLPAPVKPRLNQRWRPALAGGLAVLTIAIAMLVPWTDNQSVLDRILTSPVDVAARYMEARNAFDAASADGLLADDAFLFDMPKIDREELELGFEALRAYEWQLEPFDCESPPGATLVNCNYQMTNRLSEIVGHPPIEGRIQFLVESGQITRLVHNFNYDEYAPNVHEPFIAWLDQEHPGAFDQLFALERGVHTPILTEESLALAVTYLEEYDRFRNG